MNVEASRKNGLGAGLNVLLITFSFPPAGGVGVLRALSLAKYLPGNGVRVDVLTARNAPAVGKDDSLLRQVPAGVQVHRTWTLDLPFALRKAIKRAISGRTNAKTKVEAVAQSSEQKHGRLKAIIGNLMLPDPQIGWLPFAVPAARRIVRKRKIDVVLVTVPPFSSVRIVTKLRTAFPHLPIVLDFRDEWLSTTINLVSFNNNDRARQVAFECEREGVRDATAVVAVTQAAQAELRQRYPREPQDKFRYIPNGFDSQPTEAEPSASRRHDKAADSGGKVLLTYIGTVYGSTDPKTFVEAVLGLPERLRDMLRVRYIGHIETDAYRASLMSLGETVELKGFMPQAKALAAIQETDYLLLITHDRINVAAKFYDYLAGSKPIVAAVSPEGDVRKLLEETGAGVWADVNDVAAIREMLASVLLRHADSEASRRELEGLPRRDPARIAGYHRKLITAQYATLLQDLTGRSTSLTADPGHQES